MISGEESFIPVEHLTYTVSAAAAENGEKETISDYGGYFQIGDIREMPIVPYDPQMCVQSSAASRGDVGYRRMTRMEVCGNRERFLPWRSWYCPARRRTTRQSFAFPLGQRKMERAINIFSR